MRGPGSYWDRVSLYGRYFGGLSGVCYYLRRERQGRYFQDRDKQHAFMVLVNLLNEVENHVGEYSELSFVIFTNGVQMARLIVEFYMLYVSMVVERHGCQRRCVV
jgi:hypothetical protein